MTRPNDRADHDATQERSNIIPFPWRGPSMAALQAAMAQATSLPELQALASRYFCAGWAADGPNAVRINDSVDDDDAPATSHRLQFHPAADKFPLMDKNELAALAADIKAHGLNEDIETLDGMVIDGRNRYNACFMIGFDLTNRIHALSDNTNPIDHLISKNLMRRHQTRLERALFAARLASARP